MATGSKMTRACSVWHGRLSRPSLPRVGEHVQALSHGGAYLHCSDAHIPLLDRLLEIVALFRRGKLFVLQGLEGGLVGPVERVPRCVGGHR